jgi:glycosyltransferase involved in cell wall biosynthesis
VIRVLHIVPNLNIGGAELVLSRLARSLTGQGIESRILALESGGPLGPELERAGLQVTELTVGNRLFIPPKLFHHVRKHYKSWSPNIVQGWMYHANVAALIARSALGKKASVIWNVRMAHTNLTTEKRSTVYMVRLGAMLSARADCIIYNSSNSATLHEQSYGYSSRSQHVIPNGFDTGEWAPSPAARARIRQELDISEGELLVGMIARYHPHKNHLGFLKAAAQIARNVPNVRFMFAGSNVDWNNIELVSMIRELGLGERVLLLGLRKDVPSLTAALDLAVSPSHMEGFPNAIGEAMSCGVPCVVTNVGDSALLVGNAGMVVPPGDHEAFAAACVSMLELTPSERHSIGAKARESIVQSYSLETMTCRYAKLYRHFMVE